MKIKIKAKHVEIEYTEEVNNGSWPFMTGKTKSDGFDYTEKYMDCLQRLIDGVEQLLKA